MSHITQAKQGLGALDARKWDEAVQALSKALLASTNPAWLLARSRALISLKRYGEALNDANLAFHAAFDRNKRELLSEAHYRRAVAHFRLGQYANGDCCCMYAMRLCKDFPAIEKEDPKLKHVDENGFWTVTLEDVRLEAADDVFNAPAPASYPDNAKTSANVHAWRRASTMRQQCINAMEKLPADDAARRVTVSLKPERKSLADLTTDNTKSGSVNAVNAANVADAAAPASSQNPPSKALVVQDYQTNHVITVSIFSKGVNQAELDVEFLPDHVRLNPIVYPDGEEKEWTVRLYSQIDPTASSYKVTPKKVELCLTKKSAGKWPRLSKEESVDPGVEKERAELEALKAAAKQRATESSNIKEAQKAVSAPEAALATGVAGKNTAAAAAAGKKTTGPAYPTSSRTGPKNWDKIVSDDDDGEEEGGVDEFFKKLYSSGTDDQKRAMMKSFTESNGTTLSTDWLDVGARKVGTSPPDGVEEKKW
ncbi:hypothetical protein E4U21_007014 [Claviceps maximensis]|nr:hypothetical protein E4U21_007014 [Claviceps maximensis]